MEQIVYENESGVSDSLSIALSCPTVNTPSPAYIQDLVNQLDEPRI